MMKGEQSKAMQDAERALELLMATPVSEQIN